MLFLNFGSSYRISNGNQFVKSSPGYSHFFQMTPAVPLPSALFFSLFFSLILSFPCFIVFINLFPFKRKVLSNDEYAIIEANRRCVLLCNPTRTSPCPYTWPGLQ